MRRFLKDESGIAVTEIGLFISLVAILLIGVFMVYKESIISWISARTHTLTSG